MKPYKMYDPKGQGLHVGHRGPFARFAKWLRKVRQEQITLTLIASPRQPVRPWRLSALKFGLLVLMSFLVGTSLVGVAVNYQTKTVALNKQLQFARSLQAERDSLQKELNNQETRLVDLALQMRALQSELAEVYALREQILEVLPPEVRDAVRNDVARSDSMVNPAGLRTVSFPAGGPLSTAELMEWTQGALKVSREETSQLLTSMRTTYDNAWLHRRRLDHTPSIWPAEGWVSSEFGTRIHPITEVRSTHNGIDIAAPTGTPIMATADGVVTHAGPNGGYGLAVIIDHDYGIETLYAHASAILVEVGQKVRRGQTIALVGSTGLSTGPHLHYEIRRNSRPINPRQMLP